MIYTQCRCKKEQHPYTLQWSDFPDVLLSDIWFKSKVLLLKEKYA